MSYEIIWEPHGVIKRFSGQLTDQDLVQSVIDTEGNMAFDGLRYVINDFLAIDACSASASDVEEISILDKGASMSNPRIRIAVVTTSPEVVVLTASGTEENLLGAIRAGAAGYLLKSEPPERIALFLRGVAHGEAALSGSIARRLLDRVREGGRMGGIPDEVAQKLSAREVEVLLLLDEHLGTDEIAQRLFISEHTVRSHVKSLLKKLGVSSRREALERLDTARS